MLSGIPQKEGVLPEAVENQSDEEDDEEVVGVPEHLEVRPADELHGWSDDEDEGQRDNHTSHPGNGGEHDDGRILHQNTATSVWITAIT